jgi:hypothetical protein
MAKKQLSAVCAVFFLTVVLTGRILAAQTGTPQEDDGAAWVGSFFLSILHFPVKLVTCVGTQAVSAVAYTATFGVPGNFDGGTNGKQIGEVARKSCTGSWVISPEQVKKDYYQ